MDRPASPQTVAIVGAGVVGGATGRGLAEVGHAVTFFDADPDRVAQLTRDGVRAHQVTELRDAPADLYLVSVPTPTVEGRTDLSILEGACHVVAEALRAHSGWACVVVRSTVPPGTSDDVVAPLLDEVSGRAAGVDYGLVSNPEFLREATALDDFLHPRVIVVGMEDDRSSAAMAALYAPWANVPMHVMPRRAAEAAKYVSNLYNAAKISFFNELHRLLLALEVDPSVAVGAATEGAEGLWNPVYGTRGGAPFGGGCLPKDLDGFLGAIEDLGIDAPLLRAVKQVNESFAEAPTAR